MTCCGQKRQTCAPSGLRNRQSAAQPTSGAAKSDPPLSYQGDSSLVIKGSVTGFAYLFAAHGELGVDERDAPALKATNLF